MPIHEIPKKMTITIPRKNTDKVRLISFKLDDNTILKNAIVEIYFRKMPNVLNYGDLTKNNISVELHASSDPTESSKIAKSSSVNIYDVCGVENSYIAQIRFDFDPLAWPGLHLQNFTEYHLFGCLDVYEPDNETTYFGFVNDWSDIHHYRDVIDFGQSLRFNDSKMPIKTALFGIKSGVTYNL